MNRQFFLISGVILIVVLLTTLILQNYQPAQSMEDFAGRRTVIIQNGVYSQLGRAYACRVSGDLDNCERLLRRILESDRKNIYALVMLSDLLFSRQRYEEAARLYAEFADIAPETVPVLTNYAIALAMQGKLPEAKEQFQKALAIEPDSPLLHRHMAEVESALGNMESARTHWEFVRQAEKNNTPPARLSVFPELQDSPLPAESRP